MSRWLDVLSMQMGTIDGQLQLLPLTAWCVPCQTHAQAVLHLDKRCMVSSGDK